MPNQSYANKMAEIKVMISGLLCNAERLAKRGVAAEFIADFNARFQKVQELNSEQEALKAKLKMKTSEFETELAGLEAKASEARKIVKIEMEQESWRAFGIDAPR